MTNVIGNVYCEKGKYTWEVWTDGRAYSDHYSNMSAYRWPDGTWRQSLVNLRAEPVDASQKLEEMFERHVAGIIVNPIDPLRHLRRK